MPKSKDSIQRELYDKLRGLDYAVTNLGSDGREVPVPEESEVMQFKFNLDGKQYGTITISIEGIRKLVVYYPDLIQDSPKISDNNEMTWKKLSRWLKQFAHGHQLSYMRKNTSKLQGDMSRRDFTRRQEQISEGYTGTSKTSYTRPIPEVKLIYRHSKPIGEGQQRFRNIERIFVETLEGERLLLPTRQPGIARAFARHIAEGGRPEDQRGLHISALAEEYNHMKGFVRAARTRTFTESAQPLVEAAEQRYTQIRQALHDLSTRRGYTSYFEQWQPQLMEEQQDLSEYHAMFTETRIDERITAALPFLARLGAKPQSTPTELTEFEDWANTVTETEQIPSERSTEHEFLKLMNKPLNFGADGQNAIGALTGLLEDDELYARIVHASKDNPDKDSRPVIIDWLYDHAEDMSVRRLLNALKFNKNDKDAEPQAQEPKTTADPNVPATEPQAPAVAEQTIDEETKMFYEKKQQNLKKTVPEPRNFVAKNSPTAGAGRHTDEKNDYRRHEKHRSRDAVRSELAETELSRILKLSGK